MPSQSEAEQLTRLINEGGGVVNGAFNNLAISGLFNESATGGITANNTGTQSTAVQLSSEVNRITTAANTSAPFSAAALPPATAGLTIVVINRAANPLQVFPYNNGTDVIDGQAAGASVTMMVSSTVIFSCGTAGQWDTDGLGIGYSGSLQTTNNANGITAHAGGGQGSATPLTTAMNRVTTVGTASDSVLLPSGVAGLQIQVVNAGGANVMSVYPTLGQQINALGTNSAYNIANGTTCTFSCYNAAQWHTLSGS